MDNLVDKSKQVLAGAIDNIKEKIINEFALECKVIVEKKLFTDNYRKLVFTTDCFKLEWEDILANHLKRKDEYIIKTIKGFTSKNFYTMLVITNYGSTITLSSAWRSFLFIGTPDENRNYPNCKRGKYKLPDIFIDFIVDLTIFKGNEPGIGAKHETDEYRKFPNILEKLLKDKDAYLEQINMTFNPKYVCQIDKITEENATLKKEMAALKKEKEQISKQLAELKKENDECKKNISDITSEYNDIIKEHGKRIAKRIKLTN